MFLAQLATLFAVLVEYRSLSDHIGGLATSLIGIWRTRGRHNLRFPPVKPEGSAIQTLMFGTPKRASQMKTAHVGHGRFPVCG